MSQESNCVFKLDGDKLHSLSSHPFKDGLLGTTLEDALQSLIEKHPQLLPGQEIDPVSGNPLCFMILCREMPIEGKSLDLLLVDNYGILTLIETKLIQNPESHREVVGQILEYAANAVKYLNVGMIREKAVEFWSKKGKALDKCITEAFSEYDSGKIEDFWDVVEKNLQEGNIRLIIASDKLHPVVRRIIEYLNSEMKMAEVLGLEVSCYGEEPNLVLVPRIVGQTQRTAGKSITKSSKRQKWDETMFFEDIKKYNMNDIQVNAIKALYNFSKETADEISWGTGSVEGSFNPKFSKIMQRSLYTVWSSGLLQLNFGWLTDMNAIKHRENLKKGVENLKIVDIPSNYADKFVYIEIQKWTPKVDDFIKLVQNL